MSNTVSVEDKGVLDFLDNLATKAPGVTLKALKKGAQELQSLTKRNLRKTHINYDNSMLKGIRLKVDKSYNEVRVDILGDYRLKWFEKGTKDRRTRKGFFRGRIKANYFFKDARSSKSVVNVIMDSLDKEFKKLE
jgi:hypothetical protein